MTQIYEKWRCWQYYVIIGVVSVLALFFLPMIGSEAGLQWNLPNTTVGWIVFSVTKVIVAILNVLIFHCFVKQAKLNVRNDEHYIKAKQILAEELEDLTLQPRSPEKYLHGIYSKKSVVVFTTSIISALGLSQALITFDWLTLLTYLFTIILSIIFGILQMNETELYWTEEYLAYALNLKKTIENKRECEEVCKNITDTLPVSSRHEIQSETQGVLTNDNN